MKTTLATLFALLLSFSSFAGTDYPVVSKKCKGIITDFAMNVLLKSRKQSVLKAREGDLLKSEVVYIRSLYDKDNRFVDLYSVQFIFTNNSHLVMNVPVKQISDEGTTKLKCDSLEADGKVLVSAPTLSFGSGDIIPE